MEIVIPTYNRADVLAGLAYFKQAKFVLPESQRDDYFSTIKNEKRMIVVPDEEDGNIAKKRNWILKNVSRPLLMIDDDVCGLVMTEGVYRNGIFVRSKQHIPLTSEQALRVIENGFALACEWECVLWGVNVNTDGRNYQQYKPFSLTQVILGPFQGHLKHDLLFDEAMGAKEDYDFSLQALRKHGKVLRLNKYAYDCKHGDNQGGIVSMRTMSKEIRDCRAIEAKWGRKVIKYPLKPKKMSDLLNGAVCVPIKGV